MGPKRYRGMRDSLAREWIDAKVIGSGATKTDIQHSLRKKLAQHRKSAAHNTAVKALQEAAKDSMKTVIEQ